MNEVKQFYYYLVHYLLCKYQKYNVLNILKQLNKIT